MSVLLWNESWLNDWKHNLETLYILHIVKSDNNSASISLQSNINYSDYNAQMARKFYLSIHLLLYLFILFCHSINYIKFINKISKSYTHFNIRMHSWFPNRNLELLLINIKLKITNVYQKQYLSLSSKCFRTVTDVKLITNVANDRNIQF